MLSCRGAPADVEEEDEGDEGDEGEGEEGDQEMPPLEGEGDEN